MPCSLRGCALRVGGSGGHGPVRRVELIDGVWADASPVFRDARGSLVAREVGDSLPFVPGRFFFVFDVPEGRQRGDHAHRTCHQLLVCLRGRIDCVVDNGRQPAEWSLTAVGSGLYMPPMVWGTQRRYHDDAILMVVASHAYDPDDYIRDYSEFLRISRGAGAGDGGAGT